MLCEIISIGDELLIGQVVNTNASWIASQLVEAGIQVVRVTTVGDEAGQIRRALEEAAARAGLVIMTGGLGPTRDDITKQTLCDYFQTRLVFDDSVYANITSFFSGRGLPINALNRQQAYVPEGCTVLPNQNGTAPGMWFEKDEKVYISLPGVPFEMKALVTGQVIPTIRARYPGLGALVHRTVYTQGIPESVLAERIEHWETNLPGNLKLAYLPRAGMVRLRLSGSGATKEELNTLIDNAFKELSALLPGEVFGEDADNLEAVIGKLLTEKQGTLSTAESCTGGTIAHMITSVAGSSAYFTGSVIAYANEVKERLLGVDPSILAEHGAVSEEVVRSMARGVSRLLNTDYAIATSGIAGPGGGTAEKPVGTTWIAIRTPTQVIAEKYQFGKNRERNIQRAAFTALNMLRKELEC